MLQSSIHKLPIGIFGSGDMRRWSMPCTPFRVKLARPNGGDPRVEIHGSFRRKPWFFPCFPRTWQFDRKPEVWIGTSGPQSCLTVFQRSISLNSMPGEAQSHAILYWISIGKRQTRNQNEPYNELWWIETCGCEKATGVALHLWHLKCSYFRNRWFLGRLVCKRGSMAVMEVEMLK